MIKQISIFDGNENFVLDKPIRLIELFGGYGSQAFALKYLGVSFEHYRLSEWAVKSIQAYKDIHATNDNTDYSQGLTVEQIRQWLYGKISSDYNTPMTEQQIKRLSEKQARTIYNNMQATHNLGSITQIKAEDLAVVDTNKYCYIMTYSFPCFTADSLVLTDKGYKKIIDIQCGDMVLTHDNTYHKVVKTFDNGVKPLVKINAMAVDEIKCTPNHKFLVRSMKRVGHLQKRTFSEPKWKPAQELTKADYLGVAINQKSTIPTWNGVDYEWTDGRKNRHKNTISALLDFYDFWWIIGRYMGDGWQAKNSVIICCSKNEDDEIDSKLNGLVHYTKTEDRYKYIIPSKEWVEFVSQFGKGAGNKHLTNTIIDLPRDLLKGFLDGYMSADGCLTKGLYKATTISRELAYGIGQCVAKVYRTPYRIYHTARPKKYVIENRIVNQHDTYQVVWKIERCKQDKAFYDNGFIWFPIKQIIEIEPQNVYDIEVENNHSFTVQNTIVHNCQDLSQSGLGKGMSKGRSTRSGLLWEVERLLEEMTEKPQVLLMENVPQVIGKTGIKDFAKWVERLEQFGYKNYWQCLNAKDLGIPQNRNRCFMISLLGDYDYTFPKPQKLTVRLKDFLNKTIGEKYYLSDKTVEMFVEHTRKQKEKGNGFKFEPTDGNCIASAITTKAGQRIDDNFIKCEQVGMLSGGKWDKLHEQSRRIYSPDGLSPTIHTCAGGNLEPKIAYDEQNGYLRQDGTVGTLTTDGNSPKHNNRIVEINYDLSESMKRYINSTNEKYKVSDSNLIINRDIACTKTTREGRTRADAIDHISPNLPGNANVSGIDLMQYRIRKLTERECFKLMGVKNDDYKNVAKNQSMSSLYHLAGDSIVTSCLMAIFGELFGVDYKDKINNLVEELKGQ